MGCFVPPGLFDPGVAPRHDGRGIWRTYFADCPPTARRPPILSSRAASVQSRVKGRMKIDRRDLRHGGRCAPVRGAVPRLDRRRTRGAAARRRRHAGERPGARRADHCTCRRHSRRARREPRCRRRCRQGRRIQRHRTGAGGDRQRERRILAQHDCRGRRRLRCDPGRGARRICRLFRRRSFGRQGHRRRHDPDYADRRVPFAVSAANSGSRAGSTARATPSSTRCCGRPFAIKTNAARARFKLPPRKAVWTDLPMLYGVSAALLPAPADWPADVRFAGNGWRGAPIGRPRQHWQTSSPLETRRFSSASAA